jgi:flagella basal body P-ring formation protein FlgA
LLSTAEIDIAAEPGAVYPTAAPLLGRVLARPVQAAQAVRQTDLKHRQWFAAGDTVQLSLAGSGFSIGAEAQALSPGLEGQDTRLRLESGRIVTARPVGERRAEMQL